MGIKLAWLLKYYEKFHEDEDRRRHYEMAKKSEII